MQSTTIIAFDQHAATTVAAVLLPGARTPALHGDDVGHRHDCALRGAVASAGGGALLLRGGPVRL